MWYATCSEVLHWTPWTVAPLAAVVSGASGVPSWSAMPSGPSGALSAAGAGAGFLLPDEDDRDAGDDPRCRQDHDDDGGPAESAPAPLGALLGSLQRCGPLATAISRTAAAGGHDAHNLRSGAGG